MSRRIDAMKERSIPRFAVTFGDGMRCIGGGRPEVRRALYMASLSAVRANKVLRPLYQRLRAKGKLPKVALTAVMRRLLIFMNHELKPLPPKAEGTQKGERKNHQLR